MHPSDGIDIIIRTQEPADWKIITKKYGTNLWNALGSPPAWNSAEKLLLLALFPLIPKKHTDRSVDDTHKNSSIHSLYQIMNPQMRYFYDISFK
jgi:hypothetical protein